MQGVYGKIIIFMQQQRLRRNSHQVHFSFVEGFVIVFDVDAVGLVHLMVDHVQSVKVVFVEFVFLLKHRSKHLGTADF